MRLLRVGSLVVLLAGMAVLSAGPTVRAQPMGKEGGPPPDLPEIYNVATVSGYWEFGVGAPSDCWTCGRFSVKGLDGTKWHRIQIKVMPDAAWNPPELAWSASMGPVGASGKKENIEFWFRSRIGPGMAPYGNISCPTQGWYVSITVYEEVGYQLGPVVASTLYWWEQCDEYHGEPYYPPYE